MKHLKKYNEEIRIVKPEGSEPESGVEEKSYKTPGTKIIKIEAFDEVASKILQNSLNSLEIEYKIMKIQNIMDSSYKMKQ